MLQKRVGLYQDREATQTGKMSGCIKIQRRDTNKVGEIEVTVLQSYTHKQKEQIKEKRQHPVCDTVEASTKAGTARLPPDSFRDYIVNNVGLSDDDDDRRECVLSEERRSTLRATPCRFVARRPVADEEREGGFY